MLTEIELKNFKCYETIKITDLRNITVFTGKNNAGKSAILQAVNFLQQSISNSKFDWNTVYLGKYVEIVYKHEVDRNIEISCTFAVTKGENEYLKKYLGDGIHHIKYFISLNKDNMADKEVIFIDDIETIVFEHQKGNRSANLLLKKSTLRENLKNLSIKEDDVLKWNDEEWIISLSRYSMSYPLGWSVSSNELQKFPDYQVIEDLKNILFNKFRDIYFISDRRGISEAFTSLNEEPESVGISGENTSAKLHYLYADRNQIFDEIEKWIKKIDPEIQLLKTPLRSGKATIEFKTLLTDVNLLTGGYGLNTAFPVIMQSLISPDGSAILIEEPEIHLHRGAQEILFELFLKCIKDEKQIIFTTHSFDFFIIMWKKIQAHVFDKKLVKVWDIGSENGVRKPKELKNWENYNDLRKELKDLV
jgi:predicted ATPase